MKKEVSLPILRWILWVTLVLLTASTIQAGLFAREMGVSLRSMRWLVIFASLGGGLLLSAGLLLCTWTALGTRVLAALDRIRTALARLSWLHLPLAGLLAILPPFILLYLNVGLAEEIVLSISWRVTLFWLVTLAGALLFKLHWHERPFAWAMAAALLAYAVVYRVGVFSVDLSTYPFSLTWSETSRYFYASLFFGERLYGIDVNPTVLHPSRYALQSLPFLIDNSPLWLHRLWQVVLWLSTNALAAWLLVRRLRNNEPDLSGPLFKPLLIALWAFLFIFQGPVWYHLVVVVIVVFWGARSDRFWQTLGVVLVASLWAGVSRVNWIPLPAVLAITFYVLEQPVRGRTFIQYWTAPVIWVVAGSAAGLAAQAGGALWSGNDLAQFSSSFTADLLWYRLLPSATYPLGVAPGILLASLPIGIATIAALRNRWRDFHALRHLAILSILGVFFAGGLVVSAKIGGGSNLHNMDAYLVLLLAAGTYVVFGLYQPEQGGSPQIWKPSPVLLAAALLIPAAFTVTTGEPERIPEQADVTRELSQLQDSVAAAGPGEVLFIAERQLLTFDYVGQLRLVESYEKVFLMEMAMSSNAVYLDQFKQDLANHRFSLIVASPQRPVYQDQTDDFGEENNAWVEHVALPILCYYEEQALLQDVRVQLLQPKPLKPVCAGGQCIDPVASKPLFGRQGCIFTPDLNALSQVESAETAEQVRQNLFALIWGADLPNRLPDAQEPFQPSRYPDAARARMLTINLDFDLQSQPIFFEPKEPMGRLIIYHHGHNDNFHSSRVLINPLLAAGYHVLAFDMPLLGANPTTTDLQVHDDLFGLPRPLRFFMEPVSVGLNFALAELGDVPVYIIGLEGGAWTAMLYSALDTRIEASYLIGPPMPAYVHDQLGRFFGDFEQRAPGLQATASYLDLFTMASAGRRQVQIFSLSDPCCVSGQYAESYLPFVQATAAELGGSFDLWTESVSLQQLTRELADRILVDIEVQVGVE